MDELLQSYGYTDDQERPTKRQRVDVTTSISQVVPRGYVSKRIRNQTQQHDSHFQEQVEPEKEQEKQNDQLLKQKLTLPQCITDQIAKKTKIENIVPRHTKYTLNGHTAGINRIRWSQPNAHLLASCSMDKTVRIWDVFEDDDKKKEICLLKHHTEAVKDVQWNFDSTELISCGFDKTVQRVDVTTGKCLKSYKHKEFTTAVQYHPWQHNLFLTGGYRHGVVCWDTRTDTVVKNFVGQFGTIQSIAFSLCGNQVLTCSDITKRNSLDKAILVWDFKTSALLSNQVYQEGYTCTCLRMHPTTQSFTAQSNGGYIAIFSANNPYKLNRTKRFEGHQVSGYNLGFDISPDGSLVGTGSADGKIYFYNWYSSNIAKVLHGHSQVCMDVEFHPFLPSVVATCSWDGSIKIWE